MNPKEIDQLREHYDNCMELARSWGLTPFETDFHVVPSDKMYEIASYGIPGHYSHWTYGRDYWKQKSSYDHGQSKIYELVINANPSQAFLLENNSLLENMFVISHVIGHVHFFANNIYFADTNRQIEHSTSSTAARFWEYELKYGRRVVEALIDDVLTISYHIDRHSRIKPIVQGYRRAFPEHQFIDMFPDDAEDIRTQHEMDEMLYDQLLVKEDNDLLRVILEHGKLKEWERDVVSSIRDEMYYFLPQMQTKVMNEGFACLRGDALIPTSMGIITAETLVKNQFDGKVSDGTVLRDVTNWFEFSDRNIITLKTKSGRQISGSENHRINEHGTWKRLDEFVVGDTIQLIKGPDLWATQWQQITWTPQRKETAKEWADSYGFSTATYWRYLNTPELISQSIKENVMLAIDGRSTEGRIGSAVDISIPEIMDERFAYFLGLLIGDGHISTIGRQAGLTSGDEELVIQFAELAYDLFNITLTIKRIDNKWRALFSSVYLQDLLVSLGCTTGVSARQKTIPPIILRSPKKVVSSFLRGLYDADGYAGKCGVILSTSSDKMAKQVQNVLWNFGIDTRLELQRHRIWNVASRGSASKQFRDLIGFGLARKQSALNEYIDNHKWFKVSIQNDSIVEIQHETGTVYDITVADTHQYVAEGILNHNSLIHQKMMHELDVDCDPGGVQFAGIHSAVLNGAPNIHLNPYWLGFKILNRIIERYDDPDEKDRTDLGMTGGEGWEKMLEVIELDNDTSFLRNYLDEQLVKDLDLFSFGFNKGQSQWEITDKAWEKVRDAVVEQYSNNGIPSIMAYDFEHTLYLTHEYDGRELNRKYAENTLKSIQRLWGRPVTLTTRFEDKVVTITHDGDGLEFKQPL